MNKSKEVWQTIDAGQKLILRVKFEPGFVTLQAIDVGGGQNLARVDTIKLRNEWWLELVRYRSVKSEKVVPPWIQNPEKVSEALGLADNEEIPL